MIKRIVVFALILIVAFAAIYFLQESLISTKLSYSLFNVYLFHAIAAFVVYLVIELLAVKLASQAGYAYLAAIMIKMGLFVLIFQESILSKSLDKPEKLALIIPLFLFLIIEALGVSKLLINK